MAHEQKDLTPAELRKFGLITGAIIILFIGGFLPWWWEKDILQWQKITLPFGGFLIAWALVHPASMIYFYKPWMKLAEGLGFVNTRIILFIVFYGMFLPMGFIMRLFGKDPMNRKIETTLGSYRVARENPSRNQMEKPY
jgi:hypothetical protein